MSYKLSLATSGLYHPQKRPRTRPLVKSNLYPPTGGQTPINFMYVCPSILYTADDTILQSLIRKHAAELLCRDEPHSPFTNVRQRTRYNPSTKIKDCVAQQILFALILAMCLAQLGTLQLLMYLWPASVIRILDASDPRRRFLPHSWFISDTYAKYMNNSRKLHG